jgi:hypothetical protein
MDTLSRLRIFLLGVRIVNTMLEAIGQTYGDRPNLREEYTNSVVRETKIDFHGMRIAAMLFMDR